jgi:Bifunctional DNA primase/polymerase, N-terminal/Primase C terminal 2 (PriCT-2)
MSEAPLIEHFTFGGFTFVRRRPRDPTELRLELRSAGFSPIPVRGKNPGFAGWQEKTDASVEEIRHWGDDVFFAQRANTGILCRWTPFADIDVRDEAAAVAVEKLIRDRFGEHGKVLVRIGRAPKRGLLFRTSAPFVKIVISLIAPDGSDKDKLEFLASGQQFVAFGIHPDTGKPYTWTGGEPGEVKVADLPAITEAEARALMEDAADLLCAEHGYKRTSEKKQRESRATREPTWEQFDDSDGSLPWTQEAEARLRSALDAIPVDEVALTRELRENSHQVFVNIGRALERLGWGERGFDMWRDWCARSPEFDLKGLFTNWASFGRTRNSSGKKVTQGTIIYYAKEFGWREPDQKRAETEPTYADDDAATGAEDARAELERLIEGLLDAEPNAWERYGGITHCVHAARASTGIGKTRIAARAIARRIKSGQLAAPVGFAVPTHRLGEDIAELFRAEGISAEVWRGRKAFISGKSGPKMCDDLGAVKIAEDLGVKIEEACCKGKDPAGREAKCAFFDGCAYQAQKARKPDVWIFAHQMLFQQNKTLDGLSALFVDESFHAAGTSKPVRGLTLDEIEDAPDSELEVFRELLAYSLRRQPHLGGVPRQNIHTSLHAENITRAIKLEWQEKQKQKQKQKVMWPGMPAKQRAAAATAGTNIRHVRTFDRVWRALREFVGLEGDVVSGRLFLATHKTENGTVKVVRTRGIHAIAGQYQVRTFVMDATLPTQAVLERWFPDVRIVGEIEVPMPHVQVRQVLGAPITKKKLAGPRNLDAVRRYILRRWVETGRGDVLIICQKDIETALKETGLPAAIAIEHFNAIEGLDQYRDVRLLITIGRTQPEPAVVEADAGALSGIEPIKAGMRANRSTWYDRVTRGVRMRDGSGVAVTCDQHPDELAEAIRWQICEAEIMQAIGRGRGVNRTAANPLDIDVLADVVLPLVVDRVEEWRAPGLEVEAIADGVWLESPADMARAWPDVWASEGMARTWLWRNTVTLSLIVDLYQGKCDSVRLLRVRYQLEGPKQHWHHAWVVVPDARRWLEARLGPLAGFEAVAAEVVGGNISLDIAPLDFATPAVSVQEKPPWSAPVIEEIFPTPEELAALRALPSVVEGGEPLSRETTPCSPSPSSVPEALAPYVTADEFAAFLGVCRP